MARRGSTRYIVNLYNGRTQHTLEVSGSQLDRLQAAYSKKDKDFTLHFPNNFTFRMNLSLFECMSFAPIEDQSE